MDLEALTPPDLEVLRPLALGPPDLEVLRPPEVDAMGVQDLGPQDLGNQPLAPASPVV